MFINIGLTGWYNTSAVKLTTFIGGMLLVLVRKSFKTVTLSEAILVGLYSVIFVGLLKLITLYSTLTVGKIGVSSILVGMLIYLHAYTGAYILELNSFFMKRKDDPEGLYTVSEERDGRGWRWL